MMRIPIALALAAALFLPGLAAAEDAPGKKLFLDNKCNACHTVKSQGIAVIPSDDPEDDEKPTDLSAAGKDRTADWIAAYLMKKEAKDGEKHKKRFRGSEDELKAVSAWLAGLKGEG